MKRKGVERKASPIGSWRGLNKQKKRGRRSTTEICYQGEGTGSVHWLKEEHSVLSMPSEVNTVVRQKQEQLKMVSAVISQGD